VLQLLRARPLAEARVERARRDDDVAVAVDVE